MRFLRVGGIVTFFVGILTAVQGCTLEDAVRALLVLLALSLPGAVAENGGGDVIPAGVKQLFFDDFEDGDAGDWVAVPWGGSINFGSPSQAVETDGGSLVYSMQGGQTSGGGGARLATNGSSSWTDYTVTVDMKILETRHGGSHHGLQVRVNSATTAGYECFVSQNIGGPFTGTVSLKGLGLLRRDSSTTSVQLADTTTDSVGLSIGINQTVQIKIKVEGSRIRCWFDNTLLFDVVDTIYSSGGIGLNTASAHNHFDNVRVTVP